MSHVRTSGSAGDRRVPGEVKDAVVVLADPWASIASHIRAATHCTVVSPAEWRKCPTVPAIYIGNPGTPEIPADSISWFHSTFAGVDSLLAQAWPPGTILTRTVGKMGLRMAEYVLAWMLFDYQKTGSLLAQQAGHQWQQIPPQLVNGSRMILFGVGRMGSSIARLATANGVDVHGVTAQPRKIDSCRTVTDLGEGIDACADSDWIVSSLPLTKATERLFDEQFFQRCRGAHFINVGRGDTVDLAALRNALLSGRLRRATLDVFPKEPLEPTDPLWDSPNISITPHQAAITTEEDVLEDFLAARNALLRGERPALTVDPSKGY